MFGRGWGWIRSQNCYWFRTNLSLEMMSTSLLMKYSGLHCSQWFPAVLCLHFLHTPPLPSLLSMYSRMLKRQARACILHSHTVKEQQNLDGSFRLRPPPPSLVGAYYLQPPSLVPYFYKMICYVMTGALYLGVQNVLGGGGGHKRKRSQKLHAKTISLIISLKPRPVISVQCDFSSINFSFDQV